MCDTHEILQNKARIIENMYAINSLINIISLNDFENEVHQEFFVFALVAKKVLENTWRSICGFERVSRCFSSQRSIIPYRFIRDIQQVIDFIMGSRKVLGKLAKNLKQNNLNLNVKNRNGRGYIRIHVPIIKLMKFL